MNTSAHRASAAPRKPVLLALTAVVLAAHALLLLGTPSLWPTSHLGAERDIGEPAPARLGTDAVDNAITSPDSAAAMPSVLHSQVRWIARPAAPTRLDNRLTQPAPARKVIERPRTEPLAPRTENAEVAALPPDTSAPDAAAVTAVAPKPVETPAIDTSTAQATPVPAESVTTQSATSITTTSNSTAAPGGADRAQLAPASTVRDTDLTYDVEGLAKGFPFHAQGSLQWRQKEDRYEARLEIKAFLIGSRVQTSTGKLGPAGLRPERFSDRARSEKAAHFDQAAGRIRFSNNARDIPLLAGAQDRLSVFMQLAALLEARPQAYPPGTTIEMQVAGTGSAEVWGFKVESAAEPLNLPAGEVPAIRLYRAPRLEYDNALEVWLAPQLHHLPVRIRITQKNGDVADQQLNFIPKVEPTR